MIQCKDCEYYQIEPDNRRTFRCDPFATIKEPECLAKWQLIRLDMLVASYQGMLQWYRRIAPLTDKMLKYMKREIEEMEEGDSWKFQDESDPEIEPFDNDPDQPPEP